MKKTLFPILILIGVAYFLLPAIQTSPSTIVYSDLQPANQYLLGRNYPNIGEGQLAYEKAVFQAKKKYRNQNTAWTLEGPNNIGGRINTIAIDPNNSNTIYVGTPSAGIFKTTDGGNNWTQQFEQQSSLAIGVLAIDPTNSNTIYAGTGDEALSSFTYLGNGLWKSTDGGNTWTYIGLKDTRVISQLIIHPTNPNIIYAGTMGNIYTLDNNRGLYKTTDGGQTWNQILFLGQDAGIGDMAINESNPDTLYVTGRNRHRTNAFSNATGPAARIYRTYNGGLSWDTLTNGLPSGEQCKVTIALSQNNPNLVYASYCDTTMNYGGFYRSLDGGNTWSLRSQDNDMNLGGFGWYFGEIFIDPNNDDRVFWCGVDLFRTTNGGSSWSLRAPEWFTYDVHADKHDIQFYGSNSFLLATDGGIYKTNTLGGQSSFNWTNITNMPITQFYHVGYNSFDNTTYYGGAQDNGTEAGSLFNGVNNWVRYFGGDGFKPSFDDVDPDIFYTQTQRGNIYSTVDGGFNWDNVTQSITSTDRMNWNTPYVLSPQNNNTMYVGSYKVYKNTYAPIDGWTPISGDLTDGINNSNHTISALDQSSISAQLIYAGTSDGNVWVTQNDGLTWSQINAGLPDRYVSSIKASPNNAANVFLSYWGYRDNDTTAYLYFSDNYGSNWTSIGSGNLPQFAINDIWIRNDGTDSSILIANDGGVYSTINRGQSWIRIGNNMPIIPVYDIDYNTFNSKIFVGTFAMGVQTIGIDSAFEIPPTVNVGLTNPVLTNPKIFPNPAQDHLFIELNNSSSGNISIIDLSGKIVLRKRFEMSLQEKLNVSLLTKGVYFVQLQNEEGTISLKFLKE